MPILDLAGTFTQKLVNLSLIDSNVIHNIEVFYCAKMVLILEKLFFDCFNLSIKSISNCSASGIDNDSSSSSVMLFCSR